MTKRSVDVEWVPESVDAEAGLGDGFPPSHEPAVLAGVAVRSSRPSESDVIEAVHRGVDLVGQCTGVELTWRTAAVVSSDGQPWSWDGAHEGIDWEYAATRGEPLVCLAVPAAATATVDSWWHPKWRPVTVVADFPVDQARHDADIDTTVRVSMHRWAMYGGGEDLVRVAGFVEPWLLGVAERLGADTGYVTLDRYSADFGDSPWEAATQAAPWGRDVTRTLWGYGWGTMLSPVHVATIGGLGALDALREVVAGLEVRPVAGGRTWVRLGADPGAVTSEQIAALRDVLLPALPVGRRTIQDYEQAVTRGEELGRYIL